MKMRRIVALTCVLLLSLGLAACGGGEGGGEAGTQDMGKTQTITFQGITMEIPASWKAEDVTLSDDHAIYEELSLNGSKYKLDLRSFENFYLNDPEDSLESAATYFKQSIEDDASFRDVGDPVAGKLADTYDMHTIT